MIAEVKRGNWSEAMIHARAAFKLAKKKLGDTHHLIAKHHTNIADLALRLKQPKLKVAAWHYKRAADIRAKRLGANHGNVALTLLSLGPVEEALGKRADASETYKRALLIFEKALGPDNGYVGRTAFLLGRLRGQMGFSREAIPLLERGLAIATKVIGPDHEKTLENLAVLGWEQRVAGRYAAALASYRTLLARQNKKNPMSEEVAVTALNLGLVLKQMGKLAEATDEYRLALKRFEQLHGREHAQIATALDNLANVLAARGMYREARDLLDRAVPMWIKLRGAEHHDTAISTMALAVLLKDMGDFATALPLARRALAIFTKIHGRKSRHAAIAMDNVAVIMGDLGRYKGAEALHREALAIHEKTRGRDHPTVAVSAANIAWLLRETGRPKQALAFYQRALQIDVRRRGAESHSVATTHGQLGVTHLALGSLDAARDHLRKAQAINKKVLGTGHPYYALALANLADVEEAAGNRKAARDLSKRALAIAERHLEPLLFATSQRERLELVAQHRRKMHMVLSMLDGAGDARAAYNKVLRWKAVVLTSMIAQRQTLLAQSDKRLRARLGELARVRTELANLSMAVPAKGERAAIERKLRTLSLRKDRLERALSKRSAEFSSGQKAVTAKFRAVCRALGRRAALVDYVRYVRTRKEKRAWHLAAFVTAGGSCKQPVRIELGPVAAIDRAVRGYRVGVENNVETDDLLALGNRLRKKIWDPVRKALGARTRVFVSTDGSLNSVPFGGLPKGRRFLVEDYTFSYVANGASLLRPPPRKRRRARSSLLVGGVKYDARSSAPGKTRKRSGGCGIQSRPRYRYLPGTSAEATAVRQQIRAAKTLTGHAAGESAVKKLLPESRVVHLATHGFFARPCGGSKKPSEEMVSNPLVRSGIVLAGANATRGQLLVDGDDGILTAEEVAELDLRSVELAVLSACETGLGDIRDGEGVLGLRWAFDIAGARALMLSLWQVPDEETRQLMVAFYRKNRRKLGAAGALRAAQLEMLAKRRSEGDPRPWSWSAFIVSGR